MKLSQLDTVIALKERRGDLIGMARRMDSKFFGEDGMSIRIGGGDQWLMIERGTVAWQSIRGEIDAAIYKIEQELVSHGVTVDTPSLTV